MKFFTLVFLLASTAQASTTVSCKSLARRGDGYTVKMTLKNNKLDIIRSSRVARYAFIQHEAFETNYQGPSSEKILFVCQEQFADGYSIEMIVYESQLHIYQESPVARYHPLAFELKQ